MVILTDDGKLTLDIDVSNETIGMVLIQVQTGVERVTAYGSQTPGEV